MLLLKFLSLAAISTIAMAHSRLASPIPRDPNAVTLGPGGNCEYTSGAPSPKASYQRGQQIDVNWARNNHPGGFIRLSVVPMKNSGDKGIFDKPENIEQLHCHESVCASSDPTKMPDMLFGDPPGKNQPYQNVCSKKFTIPNHLADGDYTLQWLWYGGGDHYAQLYESEGEYLSCHDFSVRGGSAVKTKPSNACPVYKGGDVHNQGDKCLYMYQTVPGSCTADAQQEDGHVVWNCGGNTKLAYSFGYPYPNLFKSCTKSSKKRRHAEHHDWVAPTNLTGTVEDIEVVQGLEKYYR